MLVDLPDTFLANDGPFMVAWRNAGLTGSAAEFRPRRLRRGVYEANLNFSHVLEMDGLVINDYPFEPYWVDKATTAERIATVRRHHENDDPNDYGVCDEPEQILARWPQIESDPRHLLIYVTRIDREAQPEQGWRWHKWGAYIGTQKPQYEYLRDEPSLNSPRAKETYP